MDLQPCCFPRLLRKIVVVVDLFLLSLTVGLLSPRNLRISDEWYTRFRVAWDPVAAPVQGYRLTYTPTGEVTFTLLHSVRWSLCCKAAVWSFSMNEELIFNSNLSRFLDLFKGQSTSFPFRNRDGGFLYASMWQNMIFLKA